MLTSLALIFLLGLSLGGLCARLHLPPLLGMVVAGLVLGPHALGLLDPTLLSISAALRQLALVVILLRAGLALDLPSLRRVGRPAVLLCFVPACFEILGCIVLAPPLLGVTRVEAAVLGSVLAAVSPAVVVPRMLSLMERGLGTRHAIPQMVLAASSVDDVFVIVMLTVTTGLAAGGSFTPLTLFQVPVSILLGLLAGAAVGLAFVRFFRAVHVRDSAKVLVLLSLGFLLLEAETRLKAIGLPLSGMLGIMAMGLATFRLYPELAARLSAKLSRLWVAAEVLLFTLVGAAADPGYALAAGAAAVALIFGALTFRMAGVGLSVAGTPLTARERLFTAIAYTPKATVQAAVGGVPLAMGLACGNLALALAVLSILLTAPIGAFAIDQTAPWLLAPREKT
ncbi:cation:proton antiporter [Intestinibacillus massiliensis]|nr:cation:proton antiporter [Intestinibacillus massiliensis]